MSNNEQLQAILRVVDCVIEDIRRQPSKSKMAILDHLLRAVLFLWESENHKNKYG